MSGHPSQYIYSRQHRASGIHVMAWGVVSIGRQLLVVEDKPCAEWTPEGGLEYYQSFSSTKNVHIPSEAWSSWYVKLRWRKDLGQYALGCEFWRYPLDALAGVPRRFRWTPSDRTPEFKPERAPDHTPACIKALGLTLPCTVKQVKAAYRRLAKQRHPDLGGSQARFIRLQRNYEAALKLIGE